MTINGSGAAYSSQFQTTTGNGTARQLSEDGEAISVEEYAYAPASSFFAQERATYSVPVLPASHFSDAYKRRVTEIMTAGHRKGEPFTREPTRIQPFYENYKQYQRLLRKEETRSSLDLEKSDAELLPAMGNEPHRRLVTDDEEGDGDDDLGAVPPSFSDTFLRDHYTSESRKISKPYQVEHNLVEDDIFVGVGSNSKNASYSGDEFIQMGASVGQIRSQAVTPNAAAR